MKNLVLVMVFGLLAKSTFGVDIPSCPVVGCDLDDPQLSTCSARNLQQYYDLVGKGAPLIGIPKIDPTYVKYMNVHQDDGLTQFNINLKNVKIEGLSGAQFKSSVLNLKNLTSQIVIFVPEVRVSGEYNASGSILQLLGLQERGKFALKMKKTNVYVITQGVLYEKNGLTYGDILNMKVDYQAEKITLNTNMLSDLVLSLTGTLNDELGTHIMDVNEMLKPTICKRIETQLGDIAKKAFDYYPMKCFFSDIPTPEEVYGH